MRVPTNLPPPEDQLLALFPEESIDVIVQMAETIDASAAHIGRVDQLTASLTLPTFIIGGKTVYGNVERNKEFLRREYDFLKLARQEAVLRPILPNPVGFVEIEEYAGLLTWGTENPMTREETQPYLRLRREIIQKYAERTGKSFMKLYWDPLVTDVFNVALLHTYSRSFVAHFSPNGKDNIMPKEQVLARAGSSPFFREFRDLGHDYDELRKRFEDLEIGDDVTIINPDGGPRNVFPSPSIPDEPPILDAIKRMGGKQPTQQLPTPTPTIQSYNSPSAVVQPPIEEGIKVPDYCSVTNETMNGTDIVCRLERGNTLYSMADKINWLDNTKGENRFRDVSIRDFRYRGRRVTSRSARSCLQVRDSTSTS